MSATVRHVNADPEAVRVDRERRFALVVRRALLLIVRFIETEYGVSGDGPERQPARGGR